MDVNYNVNNNDTDAVASNPIKAKDLSNLEYNRNLNGRSKELKYLDIEVFR